MQAKIKIKNLERFKLASEMNDLEIIEINEYKGGAALVEVKCKSGAQLFVAGIEYEALKDEFKI
jgi:hypothetical protein